MEYDYNNVPMRLVLGDTYRKMEMYDEAIDSYKEILEISDNDFEKTESLNRIIKLLYDIEYYEETISYLKELIEIDSENYCSFMNLGLCYYNLEMFEDALKYFKESNFINPNVNSQLNISKCYYKLKKYAESNSILNNLLESCPKSSEVLLEKIYRTEDYNEKLKLCDEIICSDYNFDDPFCNEISKYDLKEYFDDFKSKAYFIKADEILESVKFYRLLSNFIFYS